MKAKGTTENDSPIIVSLDIGTTKICVTVGRRSGTSKIEILGVGKAESSGVSRGVVANIQKTVNSIRQAVVEAAGLSNVDIKVVNVGIAGQHIKSIQHRGILTRKDDSEISRLDIERDRRSVVEGRSVSVRVDHGGRRINKKKK